MHCSFSTYEDFGAEIWVLLKVFIDLNKWLQDLRRQWMLLNAWISPLSSPSFGFSIVVCEDFSSLWFSKLLSFIQAIWPLRTKIESLGVMWLKTQDWKTSHFCLAAIFESAQTPLSRLLLLWVGSDGLCRLSYSARVDSSFFESAWISVQ